MTRRTIAIGLAIALLFTSAALWAQGRGVILPGGGTERDRFKVLGHQIAILSGDDVGVRVTGQKDENGRVAGTLVVKIDGRWVDVVTPPAVTTPGR